LVRNAARVAIDFRMPHSHSHTCRCLSIEAAHVGDLIIAFLGRLVGGERKPISNQVWFEIGLF
jgi:hypothetical protein